jgi:ketosteroid isomerase-like protein
VLVDDPPTLASVTAAFHAYEAALTANDLADLDTWFWDDDRVIRFAFGEVQEGAAAVAAARRRVPLQTPPRAIDRLHITTYGTIVDGATAIAFAVFRLDETGALVHQSQVWRYADGAWRVVAAHVSSVR